MTEGEKFVKNAKCTHGHRSAMNNSAWCSLNKNCTVLKLLVMCHNLKSYYQKQITFAPKQYMLVDADFKKQWKQYLRDLKLLGIFF